LPEISELTTLQPVLDVCVYIATEINYYFYRQRDSKSWRLCIVSGRLAEQGLAWIGVKATDRSCRIF